MFRGHLRAIARDAAATEGQIMQGRAGHQRGWWPAFWDYLE
ncbi:hypothetical protein Z948_2121 [Sulfitobacter donghicola DSW-25 = KCTC 12864 = JCM 14565]|nr:hypothetical protein Z948_2121 [Sulfitobacter donghicola DSW-25 = KCTC 12864 = JCM 14565]